MNQRIKELVKQAGGEFWQRLENDVVNPEAYITFDPPESLEKFAELIVRECAGLHTKNIMVGGGTDYNCGRRMLAEDILKHFGVEE